MRKNITMILAVLFVLCLIISGCQKPVKEEPTYDRQLAPGEQALRKITDPDQIPDLTIACYNQSRLSEAVLNSLNYLSKPSSRQFFPSNGITHAHAVASLEAFQDLLDTGLRGKELNLAIKDAFDFYTSVGYDYEGTVLFTGYYTPIFNGSLERSLRFRYPLYKQPDNLIKGQNGQILGMKSASGVMTKYPDRAQIESSGMLKGNELIWLEDPFENYIVHVQGSSKIRLPDGKLITVGYAANNGHDYKSVAQALIKDGKIPADKMSLSSMIKYFKGNKYETQAYINRNPRYVFFRFEEGPPRGSLNEPVIPMRSIATDKAIYPRASLTVISTKLPRLSGSKTIQSHHTGFFLDQDTGGAIRAPGRCDVYMGEGDLAGKLAGQTYQEGRLYYLFLK